MKKKLEPWEVYSEIWPTKQSFFTWIRGQIRSIWNFYPGKLEWKKTQLVEPPKGYTGRAKKLGCCHYCKEMFPASKLEVDHVEQAGKCNSWETAYEFLYKLLDCNGNWVLACKPCHKVKSLAERNGTSFEDALVEKRVIAFLKANKAKETIAFCQSFGYDVKTLSNAAKRREALTEIFGREN